MALEKFEISRDERKNSIEAERIYQECTKGERVLKLKNLRLIPLISRKKVHCPGCMGNSDRFYLIVDASYKLKRVQDKEDSYNKYFSGCIAFSNVQKDPYNDFYVNKYEFYQNIFLGFGRLFNKGTESSKLPTHFTLVDIPAEDRRNEHWLTGKPKEELRKIYLLTLLRD